MWFDVCYRAFEVVSSESSRSVGQEETIYYLRRLTGTGDYDD